MLVLGLLSLFMLARVRAQCPEWSYDVNAANGPAHWGSLCSEFSNCLDGLYQSPIDITHTTEIFGETHKLEHNYTELRNTSFGLIAQTPEGNSFTNLNQLFPFNSGPYNLINFHLHSPGEHKINGVQFPLSVHFVHLDALDHIAVLTFFFTPSNGTTEDIFLATLAPYLPQIKPGGVFVNIPSIDFITQINLDKGFYHYTGSLTVPPCTPNVSFYISRTPIPTNPELLALFEGLNNIRPLQPLNNRTISLYSPPLTPTHHPKSAPWALAIGVTSAGLGAVFVGRYLYVKYKKTKGEDIPETELDSLLVRK